MDNLSNYLGMMEENMMVNGITVNNMEKANIINRMVHSEKEFGSKEKESNGLMRNDYFVLKFLNKLFFYE